MESNLEYCYRADIRSRPSTMAATVGFWMLSSRKIECTHTQHTTHSDERTGRGQLWLNFIFKHVFYLLCIVHFGDKKKKSFGPKWDSLEQYVVESLLTSMLLFSHGMAGQTKHNWNPSKQCSYGKYNSKMNHHRSARDEATTTRLQIR